MNTKFRQIGRTEQMTLALLREWRDVLIVYLKTKVDAEDWHGASDAANDLREIDAKIFVLKGVR